MSKHTDAEKCLYAAEWYLSRRLLTEKELRDKLREKRYDSELINDTIAQIKDAELIDDRKYIGLYAEDASVLKKHGLSRIRRDLLLKGIDRDLLDEVLETLEIDDESQLAEEMSRKLENIDINDRKQKERVFAYFARRGYGFNDIRRAFEHVKGEE